MVEPEDISPSARKPFLETPKQAETFLRERLGIDDDGLLNLERNAHMAWDLGKTLLDVRHLPKDLEENLQAVVEGLPGPRLIVDAKGRHHIPTLMAFTETLRSVHAASAAALHSLRAVRIQLLRWPELMSGLAHRQEPFVFMAAFLEVLTDRSGRPDLNHEELAALAIVIGVDKPVALPTKSIPGSRQVVEDRASMAAFLKDEWCGEDVESSDEAARIKGLNDDLFLERKARSALQRWKDCKRDGGKRLWPALTAIFELPRTE